MIIDASIALRWIVPERRSVAADELLLADGLKAPSLLFVEVGHALTKRVRRGLASRDEAQIAWTDLHAAPLAIVDGTEHRDAALALAFRLNASFYDCLYLALAVAIDDQLVTGDARFANAVATTQDIAGRVRLFDEA